MTKLIEYLKVNKILDINGTLLCNTDGCAAQYRSRTAYYLLSALDVSHGIVIQRSIKAWVMVKMRTLFVLPLQYVNPHILFAYITFIFIGIVDSLNGVTKSKLTIASGRDFRLADEAADVKKCLLQQ